MSEQTCTTNNGPASCSPATSSDPGCGCPSSTNAQVSPTPAKLEPKKSGIQSAVLLGVACLTSPCCVPLIVPIILGLLAGTPLAVWLTTHSGWLYGGLTLISAVSFFLAWRLMLQKTGADPLKVLRQKRTS
jgi:hypothetical protein